MSDAEVNRKISHICGQINYNSCVVLMPDWKGEIKEVEANHF